MSWKKLASKTVYKTHWMEVLEDKVKTESGTTLTYSYVDKKP